MITITFSSKVYPTDASNAGVKAKGVGTKLRLQCVQMHIRKLPMLLSVGMTQLKSIQNYIN